LVDVGASVDGGGNFGGGFGPEAGAPEPGALEPWKATASPPLGFQARPVV